MVCRHRTVRVDQILNKSGIIVCWIERMIDAIQRHVLLLLWLFFFPFHNSSALCIRVWSDLGANQAL